MKLTSNREFGELVRSEEPGFKTRLEYLVFYEKARNNFDDFLSQALEIWQFVPCKLVDGVWVVLEEPKLQHSFDSKGSEIVYNKKYEESLEEYEDAKKRVLFEGFGYEHTTVIKHENYIFSIEEKTIESLIKIKCFPELTKTAVNKIGI